MAELQTQLTQLQNKEAHRAGLYTLEQIGEDAYGKFRAEWREKLGVTTARPGVPSGTADRRSPYPTKVANDARFGAPRSPLLTQLALLTMAGLERVAVSIVPFHIHPEIIPQMESVPAAA